MIRKDFFKGAKFAVLPSKFEITQGVLYPGHRFAPFCKREVFPSEIKIYPKNRKTALKTREISCPMEEACVFHTLLGMEEMLDYFIADNQENFEVVRTANLTAEVSLTVFDFAKIYDRYQFAFGDLMIFNVLDWEEGSFDFDMLPCENRAESSKEKQRWLGLFEKSLGKIFNEEEYYPDIVEQLVLAFEQGDKMLIQQPVVSLDEVLEMSDKIQINFMGDQTLLWRTNDPQNETNEIPEGIEVSRGKIDSFDDILMDIGSPWRETEIEAFIREELFNYRDSCEEMRQRLFPNVDLNFTDDAQEAYFLNFLEDLWERISSRYQREKDEGKAEIRSETLILFEERATWMRTLVEAGVNPERIPEKAHNKLSDCTAQLRNLLYLLNNDDQVMDIASDDMLDMVDQIAEMQRDLINEINFSLSGNNN